MNFSIEFNINSNELALLISLVLLVSTLVQYYQYDLRKLGK